MNGLLIDTDLSRNEMNALLGMCDCYVSLHRCEGFGLGMAEAMYLGKAVIATGWSGNVQFMTRHNSALVGYRLRWVDRIDHLYQPAFLEMYMPGFAWAEPSIAHAARLDAVVVRSF